MSGGIRVAEISNSKVFFCCPLLDRLTVETFSSMQFRKPAFYQTRGPWYRGIDRSPRAQNPCKAVVWHRLVDAMEVFAETGQCPFVTCCCHEFLQCNRPRVMADLG